MWARRSLLAGFFCLSLLVSAAYSQQADQAGQITAVKPRGVITRGQQTLEAQKDGAILWKDIIETERGGRVRVNLIDGSILNIGSEARLQIIYHDATTQQSEIQLEYGKMRALVPQLGRTDSKFEVRTETAVAGVIGTDEFIDASNPIYTCALSLTGIVSVRSDDPAIPGEEILYPGEKTCVPEGQPPEPKRLATTEEIQDAVDSTSLVPEISLSPATASQDNVLQAEITGENLLPLESLSVSGEGVTAEVQEGATATRIPLLITVAADADLGARTVTLRTPRGEDSVEFIVTPRPSFALQLAPPPRPETPISVAPGDTTDPLQVLLVPLRGYTGEAELLLTGLPEGVSPILSTSTVGPGESAELSFAVAEEALPGEYTVTLEATAPGLLATAALYLQILSPPASPVIKTRVEHFYNRAEPPEILTGTAFRVLQGALLRIDASDSGVVGGKITEFAWQIVDTRIRGQNARFEIDTWELAPGNYRIQLRVTSEFGTTAQQEYTLAVDPLPNPDEVLFGLKQAYETLQINQYLGFFDPLRFRAYPALEESIRNSFQKLSEARVYLRVDNRQHVRDDAVYQITFEVDFRTKEEPDLPQRQIESITMRLLLLRSRDTAVWKITDFSITVTPIPCEVVNPGSTVCGTTGGTETIVTPNIRLVKAADSSPVPAGSAVTYSYQVTNTGNTELINIEISDDKLGTIGTIESLAAGSSQALTASAAILQTVTNTGTVTGIPAQEGESLGLAPVTARASATVEALPPAVELVKTAGTAADGETLFVLAGTAVTYSYRVTNSGATELINVQVSDNQLGPIGTITSLAPGASATLTASTSLTTDVTNQATVTATPAKDGVPLDLADVSDSDDAVVDVVSPAVELIKTAGNAADDTILTVNVGDSVTYNYEVTNTGDTELININVSDDQLGPVGTITSLAPGASQTLTATTTISADVTNLGTVTATPAQGGASIGLPDVTASDDAVVEAVGPQVQLIKTAGSAADGTTLVILAGTTVTYSFQVTNVGDTELINIRV
ncbi:MAG: FecR domain-containing protein, partial [Candidatus Methylomirabilales bacterium]